MSKPHQQLQYYIPGIVLFVVSLVILFVWDATLSNFLLGMLLAGAGLSLCLLGYWKGQSSKERNLLPNNESTNTHIPDNESTNVSHRSIHMQSGTYNESIQGDCITIQGNQIYINQDLSQFTAQIQEVLSQLQNRGYSGEAAEQQIAEELKKYADRNARIKERLLHWKKSGNSTHYRSFKTTEPTKRIIELASGSRSNKSSEPILVLEDRYKRLDSLLRNGAWEEADEETVDIVLNLMPERTTHFTYRYYNYSQLNADQISPGVLRKLNQLWFEHSNGRFGFSVQQSIWKEILKDYNHSELWVDEEAYLAFIDAVGWTRNDDRIYHVDFNYSLWATKGHLPASLMLASDYIYPSSNYCYLNTEVFDTIMQCKYSNTPFIPSWLQQWVDVE